MKSATSTAPYGQPHDHVWRGKSESAIDHYNEIITQTDIHENNFILDALYEVIEYE